MSAGKKLNHRLLLVEAYDANTLGMTMENTSTNTAFYDVMFPRCAISLNNLEMSAKAAIQSSLSDIDELSKRIRSLPTLQMKLLGLLRKPDTHHLEIVDLINQDPSLALRVHKIVNSAEYTAGFEIQDLGTAVARLGINGISDIASTLLMKSLHPQNQSTAGFMASKSGGTHLWPQRYTVKTLVLSSI